MKRLGLGLLAAVTAGCSLAGNGYIAVQQRGVAGFNRLRVTGPFSVEVHDGRDFQLTLLTDSNLFDHVETRLEAETLAVSFMPESAALSASALRVIVELPSLAGAELSGSGKLRAVVHAPRHDVDLALDGSGQLTLVGDVGAVDTWTTGTGTCTLTGTASSWTATVDGTAKVDGQEMPADDAALSMLGDGALLAVVNHTVAFDVRGAGSIDWWGEAAVASSSQAGPGTVTHH